MLSYKTSMKKFELPENTYFPQEIIDYAAASIPTCNRANYKQEFDEITFRILAAGNSIEFVCACLSITKPTLYRWRDLHETFDYAIELGFVFSKALWIKVGEEGLSKEHFGWAGYQMQMRNRWDWDKSATEKYLHYMFSLTGIPISDQMQKVKEAIADNKIPISVGKVLIEILAKEMEATEVKQALEESKFIKENT